MKIILIDISIKWPLSFIYLPCNELVFQIKNSASGILQTLSFKNFSNFSF